MPTRTLARFLTRIGLLGVSLAVASCAAGGRPVSRTEIDLLGTVCTITIYDNKDQAAMDAAFDRIREIEKRMKSEGTESEVTRINEAAGVRPVSVSPDTFQVIEEGIVFSSRNGGVFDITVGPLVKLWGIGTDKARVPSEEEIKEALSRVSFRRVQLSEEQHSVFLMDPGMSIDLGAIGKGYAADEASRILRERGAKTALINLGGNILTFGTKPDGSPWRIGVQDPEQPRGSDLGLLRTAPVSVVTSGGYERFFIHEGKRYHHILDTRTGYPSDSDLLAVAIVTPAGTLADCYSTLLFAIGMEAGLKVLAAAPMTVDAVFITKEHEVYVTPGIKNEFRLTSSAYTLKDLPSTGAGKP